MSALVVRPGKLAELVNTMEAIQSELYTDEVAEIANINSVGTRAVTPLVYFGPPQPVCLCAKSHSCIPTFLP